MFSSSRRAQGCSYACFIHVFVLETSARLFLRLLHSCFRPRDERKTFLTPASFMFSSPRRAQGCSYACFIHVFIPETSARLFLRLLRSCFRPRDERKTVLTPASFMFSSPRRAQDCSYACFIHVFIPETSARLFLRLLRSCFRPRDERKTFLTPASFMFSSPRRAQDCSYVCFVHVFVHETCARLFLRLLHSCFRPRDERKTVLTPASLGIRPPK